MQKCYTIIHMHTTQHLPEAMPSIEKRTLLVVCDTHQALFYDVGGHTITLQGTVESPKEHYSDHETRIQSPSAGGRGGMVSSTAEPEQTENNRLNHFANMIFEHARKTVESQGIQEVYLSAPNKMLGVLRQHMPKAMQALVKDMMEGNVVHESSVTVLARFRPDLQASLQALRDMENYSPKNQPPKK